MGLGETYGSAVARQPCRTAWPDRSHGLVTVVNELLARRSSAAVSTPPLPTSRRAPAAGPAVGPRPTLDLLTALMTAYAHKPEVRRIAVVGNAPVLPDAERAAAIDDCDLVIRVNGFALDDLGAPAATGRRADVVLLQWAVHASPWLFQDYSRRLYLLNEPGQMYFDNETVPAWWPADLGLVRVPNREVTSPLTAALGLAGGERPRWATTGTVGMYLAHRCFPAAEWLVSGFSMLDDPDQRAWAHAYGDPVPVNDHHDLRAEAALVRRLVATGQVSVLP